MEHLTEFPQGWLQALPKILDMDKKADVYIYAYFQYFLYY
jgi:hypothetical protein